MSHSVKVSNVLDPALVKLTGNGQIQVRRREEEEKKKWQEGTYPD